MSVVEDGGHDGHGVLCGVCRMPPSTSYITFSNALPNTMAEMLLPLDMLSLDDPFALAFKRRNNVHIYLSDELIFGRNLIVYPFNFFS